MSIFFPGGGGGGDTIWMGGGQFDSTNHDEKAIHYFNIGQAGAQYEYNVYIGIGVGRAACECNAHSAMGGWQGCGGLI